MSLSDDAVALSARLQAAGTASRIFETTVRDVLRAMPDFQDFAANLAPKCRDPEVIALIMLRALATQKSDLAPRIADTSLVATYPGVAPISARHTPQVIREMLSTAADEIIVAGFAISRSGGLRDLLISASQRVRRIMILCSDWKGDDGVEAGELITMQWPNARCVPKVYRYAAPNGGAGMHIKCLIADSREVLVGSANFTKAGMKENFELGIHVRGALANAARLLFEEFIRTGRFEEIGQPGGG